MWRILAACAGWVWIPTPKLWRASVYSAPWGCQASSHAWTLCTWLTTKLHILLATSYISPSLPGADVYLYITVCLSVCLSLCLSLSLWRVFYLISLSFSLSLSLSLSLSICPLFLSLLSLSLSFSLFLSLSRFLSLSLERVFYLCLHVYTNRERVFY